MEFILRPIDAKKLEKYGDKIFVKFYKPIITDTNNTQNIQPYEPHQGYIRPYQKSINKSNLYRFTSIENPNIFEIQQCPYIGKDNQNNDLFDTSKSTFVKHQYFRAYKVPLDKMDKFNSILPSDNPNSKKYIRLEYAGQCYYIGENTEFKVDENTHYIVERKFKIVDNQIVYENEIYTVNNKIVI